MGERVSFGDTERLERLVGKFSNNLYDTEAVLGEIVSEMTNLSGVGFARKEEMKYYSAIEVLRELLEAGRTLVYTLSLDTDEE